MKAKKLKMLIAAAVLAMTLPLSVQAQTDGFFDNWDENTRDDGGSISGGEAGDFGETVVNTTPLGSGLLILVAAGAGYGVVKSRKVKGRKVIR